MWIALAWQAVLEALFPARCLGCGVRGSALCGPCRAELPLLPSGTCQRCAAMRTARGVCRGCRQLSPRLRSVRAVFAYAGLARSAVLALKFRSGRHLAPLMAEWMAPALRARPLQAEVVVPVPLSPQRLRERGYNQALLLAHAIAARTGGATVAEVLSREHRTPQQSLDAAQRLKNLEGAVHCRDPGPIRGRRVIVVDDVVTTGATLSACAEALARAGATRVSGLAFARDL